MRGFVIGILVMILLALLAWWAGWLSFNDTGSGKEIDIDKKEFQRDVDEAGSATKKALEDAKDAVDEATRDDAREPVESPQS